MTRTLLIDGDVIAYKIAASIERPIKWDDTLWTLHSDENEGIAAIEGTIGRLMDTLKGDECIVALTDQEANFRLDFWPLYKAHRKKVRRPICLQPMREYLLDRKSVV